MCVYAHPHTHTQMYMYIYMNLPGKTRENVVETIFKEIMAENFLELMTYILRVKNHRHRIPSSVSLLPLVHVVKLLDTKQRETSTGNLRE